MRNIDDSVEWMVRGDNALTGLPHRTYNGDGKLAAFDTREDAQVADRVFAK